MRTTDCMPLRVVSTPKDKSIENGLLYLEDVLQSNRSKSLMGGLVESIPHGFALFDRHDRYVAFNTAYRRLYATSADLVQPGVHFVDVLRDGAKRGQYSYANGNVERWVRERLERHRTAYPPETYQLLDNGRWLKITEKALACGGRIGLRIDVTDVVRAHPSEEKACGSWASSFETKKHAFREGVRKLASEYVRWT